MIKMTMRSWKIVTLLLWYLGLGCRLYHYGDWAMAPVNQLLVIFTAIVGTFAVRMCQEAFRLEGLFLVAGTFFLSGLFSLKPGGWPEPTILVVSLLVVAVMGGVYFKILRSRHSYFLESLLVED